MSVFICYSHEDKDFVEKLSVDLVKNKIHIWLDTWELQVGDSLIEKIDEAITESEAILVVLSKSSLESAWCKKELNASLIRELSEKNVLVLPLLIEDCEIPLFLREKKYADFKTDYNEALRLTLETIAKFTSENLGRFKLKDSINDFNISWGMEGDFFKIEIYIVSIPPKDPYSVLTKIELYGNEVVTEKFLKLLENGIDRTIKTTILGYLTGFIKENNETFLLKDNNPVKKIIHFQSSKRPDIYSGIIEARRLGEDSGKDILVNMKDTLNYVLQSSLSSSPKLSSEEIKSYFEIMGTFEN